MYGVLPLSFPAIIKDILYAFFMTLVDTHWFFLSFANLKLFPLSLDLKFWLKNSLTAYQIYPNGWGGEFILVQKFLSSNGISYRQTYPHTHHQNGSVEKKLRHIVNTDLARLAHSHVPLQYWDDAFDNLRLLILLSLPLSYFFKNFLIFNF